MEQPAGDRSMDGPIAMLGAVREDIRQTLRVGWMDPAIEAIAPVPAFFTAAWSAIRPNVGKSFLLLARALRTEAADAVRAAMDPPDLRQRLRDELSEEELRRVEDSVRAAQLAASKIQIVVHALARAVRRERIPGTGREEPPVRRGVPDWQRWMSFQPPPEEAKPVLRDAAAAFELAGAPGAVRLLARWPAALRTVWAEVDRRRAAPAWTAAATRLRRTVLSGISTLPHPVELQWTALRARGFGEPERQRLSEVLATIDASMPGQTLTAALAWLALGSPEIGVEG
jgi:hypothetical protein